MPNHVKSKVIIIGEPKEVEAVIAAYSTHFETVPSTAYNGDLVYKKKETDYKYGWLNSETNVFTTRDENAETIEVELTDEWEQQFEEAWTRFPDFKKIVEMPESLNVDSTSLGDMGLAILTGVAERYISFEETKKRFDEMSEEDQEKCLELGKIYKSNLEKYGHTTWYDWCRERWGTKWNAYSCEKVDENTFLFETAWSGVPHLIQQMSDKFPAVKIEYRYSDEDFGYNCGSFVFEAGERIKEYLPQGGSDEAYEIAFELRPDYKEDMHYVEGEGWKWNEE